MGGRGSWSSTYDGKMRVINVGDASSSAALGNVDSRPDNRKDIQKMFVDELGVTSIGGTQSMSQATIGAVGIRLKELEKKYGVIADSPSFEIVTADGLGFKGAMGVDPNTGAQTLYLSPSALGNVTSYNKGLAMEQRHGEKMPTNGTVKSQYSYTVTHEYGHALQNVMYAKATRGGYKGTSGQYAEKAGKEIISIATKKYNGTQKSLSSYGATNYAEFFAEAFASANLGKPTAVGKAMNDWLKKNGY